jgi:anthranilate phosphoribosyltransferase
MAAPVDLRRYLDRLIVGDDSLSADEAAEVAAAISEGAVDPLQLSAFLVLLAARGESSAVIFGFARTLRDKAVRVAWETSLSDGHSSCDSASSAPAATALLDIVGTGGDGHNSLNISTAASIVAAAGGCVVAKHGSVSVSSRSGSADVLLHLGIPHLPADRIGPCLEDAGIAFMFAPLFHPALKEVVPVRKALKVRTIFNILGPLLNPAGAKRLVLGVFKPALLHVYAEAVAGGGARAHCALPPGRRPHRRA